MKTKPIIWKGAQSLCGNYCIGQAILAPDKIGLYEADDLFGQDAGIYFDSEHEARLWVEKIWADFITSISSPDTN